MECLIELVKSRYDSILISGKNKSCIMLKAINVKIIWKISFAQKLPMLTFWWYARIMTVFLKQVKRLLYFTDVIIKMILYSCIIYLDHRPIKTAYSNYFIIWKSALFSFIISHMKLWETSQHYSPHFADER